MFVIFSSSPRPQVYSEHGPPKPLANEAMVTAAQKMFGKTRLAGAQENRGLLHLLALTTAAAGPPGAGKGSARAMQDAVCNMVRAAAEKREGAGAATSATRAAASPRAPVVEGAPAWVRAPSPGQEGACPLGRRALAVWYLLDC